LGREINQQNKGGERKRDRENSWLRMKKEGSKKSKNDKSRAGNGGKREENLKNGFAAEKRQEREKSELRRN